MNPVKAALVSPVRMMLFLTSALCAVPALADPYLTCLQIFIGANYSITDGVAEGCRNVAANPTLYGREIFTLLVKAQYGDLTDEQLRCAGRATSPFAVQTFQDIVARGWSFDDGMGCVASRISTPGQLACFKGVLEKFSSANDDFFRPCLSE